MRKAFMKLALGAILAIGIGSMLAASSASAQTVTCSNVNNSPTQWPEAGTVRTCSGTGTPSNSGLVRGTLETIGAFPNDAAQRLRRQVITDGEVISITITDSSLPGGSATVSHTAHGTQTTGADSLYTIGDNLASQINALGSGSDFYAYVSGNVVTILSFTGTTSGYSMSSSGSSVTITAGTNANGDEIATLGAQVSQNWTWFDFANAYDFEHSNPANGGINGPAAPPSTLPADAYGDSYLLSSGSPPVITGGVSGILENNAADGANQKIPHTTAHETGHRLDYLYGRKFGVGSGYYSDSSNYQNMLALDRDAMGQIPACRVQASDQTNDPGPGIHGDVPSGLSGIIDRTGNYVCDNGGDGFSPSATWLSILDDDNHFRIERVSGGSSPVPGELFAEQAAYLLGFDDLHDNSGNDINGSNGMFYSGGFGQQSYFCTLTYVAYLVEFGREPTSDELAPFGYFIPDGPIASGPDAGRYGPGATFKSCNGSTIHGMYSFGA